MTEFFSSLFISSIAVFAYMTAGFLVSVIRKRNDVADILWGGGFILVAFITLLSDGNFYERQILVSLLVLVWGLRLGLHIYLRNKNKPEDHRYKVSTSMFFPMPPKSRNS